MPERRSSSRKDPQPQKPREYEKHGEKFCVIESTVGQMSRSGELGSDCKGS